MADDLRKSTTCDVNIVEKVYSATAARIGTAHNGYTLTYNLQEIPTSFHYTKLAELNDVPTSEVRT
jgi:hypothetical protein